MPNALPGPHGLVAHSKAIEAAAISIALVMRVPAPLESLADQVVRAARQRSGRDRIHHWRIAYASAKEVDSHLRLLTRANAVNTDQANAALGLNDEVRAMTWRLLNPRR